MSILTITDRGTTGLDGRILNAQALTEREQNQGQLVIESGENWAAWEAMRYTKSGEDSLGSRGQGKYAYLFHSLHHPPNAPDGLPQHSGRVIILYDTLLPSGQYRLGIRYHNPSSKVIEPPFLNDEAIKIIETDYSDYQSEEQIELPSSNRDDPRIIKRCVLFHDSGLANQDQDGPAQLNGVQLLRSGQWIFTLEMNEFSDWIPKEYREGFRGFVEFDRVLERELRKIETPAHDGYNRRKPLCQEIVQEIRNQVKKFAVEKGWHDAEDGVPDPKFDSLVQEFARLFVSPEPGSHTPSSVGWHCDVNAAYPDPATAAVGWGEAIRVEATCRRCPAADGESIAFNAKLVRPDGSSADIFTPRHQNMAGRSGEESTAGANFGELAIDHPGRPGSPFTEPGRYSIEVRCTSRGTAVATGKCSFYVACDPPEPAPNPVTIQLQAFNPDDSSNIIPQGGVLQWKATVRNRGQLPVHGAIDIVLEEHILGQEDANLDEIAIGDQPQILALEGSARILRSARPAGTLPLGWDSPAHEQAAGGERLGGMVSLPLPDGRYSVVASLEQEGKTLATARATIWVGTPGAAIMKRPCRASCDTGRLTATPWPRCSPGDAIRGTHIISPRPTALTAGSMPCSTKLPQTARRPPMPAFRRLSQKPGSPARRFATPGSSKTKP